MAELQRLRAEDPDAFLAELRRLRSDARTPSTKRFWLEMIREAKRERDEEE